MFRVSGDPDTVSLGRRLVAALSYKSDESLSFLLASLLVLLFVVYPFLTLDGVGRYVTDAFFSLVLVSGTLAVERRRWRQFALVLAGITLVTRWTTYVRPERELLFANVFLGTVFLAFASVVILGRVFAAGRVTRHRIEGAVAVYLLIGLVFGLVYALIAMFEPNAFDIGPVPTMSDPRGLYDFYMARFSYFSFITLTTVGYGDVTPLASAAKQMAVLEGLIGQLYPAILLARLVSMEIAGRGE